MHQPEHTDHENLEADGNPTYSSFMIIEQLILKSSHSQQIKQNCKQVIKHIIKYIIQLCGGPHSVSTIIVRDT